MNAELWSRTDEESQKCTLKSFLRDVNVKYNEDMNLEELRNLYIKYECGELL